MSFNHIKYLKKMQTQHPFIPSFFALIAGLLFGIGLLLSGMTDPSKVLGFLDLAGLWNPSLAFVMGGAIGAGFIAFAIAQKRQSSVLGNAIELPKNTKITKRLLIGSVLFGVGWGLAGFCPGPAIVSLAMGQTKAAFFVLFMLFGMALYSAIDAKK